nr:MAG TPA: hypothetical protein [Caudoviricetes sp.]
MFATLRTSSLWHKAICSIPFMCVQNKCKFRPCVKFHYLGLHKAFYILWRMLWKKEM